MIDNEKRQDAINLAAEFILADATYYRPSDLPDIDLNDYNVIVKGDDIRLIHKREGIQLGNTESLHDWLELAEEE